MFKSYVIRLSAAVVTLLSACSMSANEVYWWVGTTGDPVSGRLEINDAAFGAKAFESTVGVGSIARLDIWGDAFAFNLDPASVPPPFAFITGSLASDQSVVELMSLAWLVSDANGNQLAGIIGDQGSLAVFPTGAVPALSLGSWVRVPGRVPDASTTATLLGLGVLGLGIFRRRFGR